ncbi:hypothetical protein PR048_030716 [Dryococelus australis]|uniref:Uncharacterized protein n=1 Tax=Dryococelus australis TaxID=614101 RepID=A0ABQ9GA56_9NEOP|nr:hypothetical protein PR048_030716 [Dryococelus australis]
MGEKLCENGAASECQGGRETGGPRENPVTSDIVRHDCHLRKSGSGPAGGKNPVRFGGRRARTGRRVNAGASWQLYHGMSGMPHFRLSISSASVSATLAHHHQRSLETAWFTCRIATPLYAKHTFLAFCTHFLVPTYPHHTSLLLNTFWNILKLDSSNARLKMSSSLKIKLALLRNAAIFPNDPGNSSQLIHSPGNLQSNVEWRLFSAKKVPRLVALQSTLVQNLFRRRKISTLSYLRCLLANHRGLGGENTQVNDSVQLAAANEKIDLKRVYTEVTFAIGSEFTMHALDYSDPIADLQGNKKRIPCCQTQHDGNCTRVQSLARRCDGALGACVNVDLITRLLLRLKRITLTQSSPSTVTAGNQCAVGIGISVHATVDSSLQVIRLANFSGPYSLMTSQRTRWIVKPVMSVATRQSERSQRTTSLADVHNKESAACVFSVFFVRNLTRLESLSAPFIPAIWHARLQELTGERGSTILLSGAAILLESVAREKKTRRPAASSGAIPTCENTGATSPEIEYLPTKPPRPRVITGVHEVPVYETLIHVDAIKNPSVVMSRQVPTRFVTWRCCVPPCYGNLRPALHARSQFVLDWKPSGARLRNKIVIQNRLKHAHVPGVVTFPEMNSRNSCGLFYSSLAVYPTAVEHSTSSAAALCGWVHELNGSIRASSFQAGVQTCLLRPLWRPGASKAANCRLGGVQGCQLPSRGFTVQFRLPPKARYVRKQTVHYYNADPARERERERERPPQHRPPRWNAASYSLLTVNRVSRAYSFTFHMLQNRRDHGGCCICPEGITNEGLFKKYLIYRRQHLRAKTVHYCRVNPVRKREREKEGEKERERKKERKRERKERKRERKKEKKRERKRERERRRERERERKKERKERKRVRKERKREKEGEKEREKEGEKERERRRRERERENEGEKERPTTRKQKHKIGRSKDNSLQISVLYLVKCSAARKDGSGENWNFFQLLEEFFKRRGGVKLLAAARHISFRSAYCLEANVSCLFVGGLLPGWSASQTDVGTTKNATDAMRRAI